MKFGGWMTVTNIIGPLLVYVDRLFIGALVSITAVAYYATPSEVITKLILLSVALTNVLFPAISSSFGTDRQRSALFLERGLKYVFLGTLPIILLIVAFAPEGLAFWLDDHFVQNSLWVTRILAVGIFFACLGQILYAFIQGAGRPDLTGKLNLIECPPYIILLAVSINWAGITGAAVIWTIRFFIDTLSMYLIAQKMLGNHRFKTISKMAAVLLALGAISMLALLKPVQWRAAGYLLSLIVFIWAGFFYLLSGDEKEFLKKIFRV
jgi:O-antigen/teichoic acid export membrane protein